MDFTTSEKYELGIINNKINELKHFIKNNFFDNSSYDMKYWYNYLNNIKNIIGNFNDTLSFISCLMAKEYLMERYIITDFDVGIKSQSSPGLDIDILTVEGKRIIAEIKTTKSINENDFGSKQKESVLNDIKKLLKNSSDYIVV